MTAKELIEIFKNIKDECGKHRNCDECIFGQTSPNYCRVTELLQFLVDDSPC